MTETELFAIVQQTNEQVGALFAQVITINFAMIIATWYFLRRTRLAFRLSVFAFYLVGMLTLIGMMLQQSNIKHLAINALTAIPPDKRSSVIDGYLPIQEGWLFVAARIFQNASLWMLVAVIAYLLFWWRQED